MSQYNLNKSQPSMNQLRKADSKYFEVGRKFTQFKDSEIDLFIKQFQTFDKDGNGHIDKSELHKVCQELGEAISTEDLSKKIAEVDQNNNNTVEFDEFLQVIAKIRERRVGSDKGFGALYQKQARLVKMGGATEASAHSINEDEHEQFVLHINAALKNDADVQNKLPINPVEFGDLYEKCKDGLVLCKLINDSVPDTIDERVLNKGNKLNTFQKTENNNVVVNSAKAIGCSVVNIGAQDLIEGREILILGLVWQIIKIGLFAKVDLKFHPELFRLLEQGETLDDLFKLPVDQILLRWFNYHLKKAGWNRKVTNFTSDIKDSENYIVLLNQLEPSQCSRAALNEKDLKQRAEQMLVNADKLECRKYVTPKAIVEGNQKLNLAFVANLFNNYPGLEPLTETEKAALDDWLFNSQGDREARAFALWLNSLNVDPFVNNLYEDLRDGIVLLQAFDKVHPGCVEWKRVNKGKGLSKFKAVENTNYVVELGKHFKYSLVGIQGADIFDGNKKLTLAIVWQLMRDNVIQILKSVAKDGKEVTEQDMVNWANSVPGRVGKKSSMSGFKDSSLKTSLFFLDVLAGIKKGIVDYNLVTAGDNDDDAKLNAKYAISIARKLGATIFVLPEDLMEVKPKMILTFVGALMALDKNMVQQ
ncbi:hypothetical protein MP228_004197 [Amoeboaphelidium protococcarum]|nr:hypothetical protein MP228_004197 [Amoeboaphelidium protococcarum]